MQIKVKQNNRWVLANPDYFQAYQNYKNQPIYHPEEPVTTRSLTVYRTNNDVYLPTYIRDGDNIYPIADFEDVRVFLLDWYAARNYQIWAYYDFMYDNQQKKTYASKNSIRSPSTVEIDIDGLFPNIIFSISRNENNSVYYERNDERGTRVRICDNHMARIGYRGFYTRMTMDVGMIVTPPPMPQVPVSSLNGLPPVEETDIEEDQCILCYKNKKNITLSPCNHNIMCSACYVKLEKKNECPVCRGGTF
jgi:hypothetical protein